MLSDNPRMTTYKNAILNNKELFLNKIVMDIGAGTGKCVNKFLFYICVNVVDIRQFINFKKCEY